MRTPQLHLVGEAVMRGADAGRDIHIRPRQLPPRVPGPRRGARRRALHRPRLCAPAGRRTAPL